MPELTPEQMFAQCDWTNRDNIVQLFPQYVQEQVALQKITKKSNYPKNFFIPFLLYTTLQHSTTLLSSFPLPPLSLSLFPHPLVLFVHFIFSLTLYYQYA